MWQRYKFIYSFFVFLNSDWVISSWTLKTIWSSFLYLSNFAAFKTAYFPCLTFGQIAEVLDAGELSKFSFSPKFFSSFPLWGYYFLIRKGVEIVDWALGGYIYLLMMPALCSHWLMGSMYRAKLRRKYGLVEAPHSDIISHIICPCCALAQEFRELKKHGLDPSLGK